MGFNIILLLLFIFFFIWHRVSRKIPPGPIRLPLIGSIPFVTLKKGILDWTMDAAVTRNKISTLQLGPVQIFVINDFDLAKNLFGMDEFSGRRVVPFQLAHKFFSPQEGHHWETQKIKGLWVWKKKHRSCCQH